METAQRPPSGWAMGWITFAGIFMIMVGVFHGISGIVQLVDKDFVAVTANYAFKFNVTTWGWIHIIVGVLLVLSGIGVFAGNVAARTVGVFLALLSAIAAFAWLPHQPWWSVMIILIDVAVIWALTVHGRDMEAAREY